MNRDQPIFFFLKKNMEVGGHEHDALLLSKYSQLDLGFKRIRIPSNFFVQI
jgi:hypothetical protein